MKFTTLLVVAAACSLCIAHPLTSMAAPAKAASGTAKPAAGPNGRPVDQDGVELPDGYETWLPVPKPAPTAKPAAPKPAPKAIKPARRPPAAKPAGAKQSRPKRFPEPRMAGGTANAVVDIKASGILGAMDKTYRLLDTFTATLDARGSDNSGLGSLHATIGFSRKPERAFAIVTKPALAKYIYDGTHVVVYPAPDSSHFLMFDNAWDNLAGSGIGTVFGRLAEHPRYDFISRMVTSGFQAQVDLGAFDKLVSLAPSFIEGVMCDRVQSQDEEGSITLAVGHEDHLLRRVTWVTNLAGGATSYYIENFSSVTPNPVIPSSAFKFTPPPGVSLWVSN